MVSKPTCCQGSSEGGTTSSGRKSNHHRGGRIDYLLWISLSCVSVFFIVASYFPLWVSSYPRLSTVSHTVHHMVLSVWWGAAIGMVFVGIMSKVPREFIISILGKGGTMAGLVRATGAGVLLDLCSHGILMVATKLYERGASAGQVVAFLLASPWNSFSLTLILIGLIGLKWTVVFIALSMLVAIVTGWIFDRLVELKLLPANLQSPTLPEDFNFWSEAREGFRTASFNFSFFKDIVVSGIRDSRMVVRWLLFGILLAALMRVIFDAARFEQFFGPTLLGLVTTIFIATVLEVCSEGSTPIAADILNRAKAPGNGFAFLMAGMATDYTEIVVLKEMSGSWKLALFVPLITLPQVFLLAFILNMYSL